MGLILRVRVESKVSHLLNLIYIRSTLGDGLNLGCLLLVALFTGNLLSFVSHVLIEALSWLSVPYLLTLHDLLPEAGHLVLKLLLLIVGVAQVSGRLVLARYFVYLALLILVVDKFELARAQVFVRF